MNAVPLVIFWALAVWAMASRGPGLLYLFFASMPFGAFAVIPPVLTGGLTFTATPIVTLLIIARALATTGGPAFFLTSALLPRRLLLLFLFWIVSVVTTIFMPRLFAHELLVVPFRGALELSPLQPTPQNISQLAYLSISILAVFAFARLLQSQEVREHALKALCFGGAVAAATGFIDYLSQFVALDPLLAPFRTATYALATNIEVLGVKRIVGLMPEASAFGGLCLALLSALYFFRRAIIDDTTRNIYAPAVMGLLALCCWLSTSSGTYLGVAVLIVVASAEWLLRAHAIGDTGGLYRRGVLGELSVVVSLVIVLALMILLRPAIMDPVFALIDRMVLEKTSSSSFEERGMWRMVALNSIGETYGFGVGVGSTRSSSSIVAIFSGTGVLGGLLYHAFVLQALLRSPVGLPPEEQLIQSAFRFSFIPPFVVSLVVGNADFGGIAAFSFGIVTAVAIAAANPANPDRRTSYEQTSLTPSPDLV